MKILKINILIILFTTLFACNNKENKTNESQKIIADKSEVSSDINSPCDLISMEEVKNIFAIGEYQIEMKDKVYTFPTCIFKWEDGKVTTSQYFGGQEIKSNLPSEVLIVMVKNANEEMFNRSTSIYKQSQEISNMGQKAVWDERMSQLTFLSNKYMFHVHVKVSNNKTENKEKAIELARLIIKEKLQ